MTFAVYLMFYNILETSIKFLEPTIKLIQGFLDLQN